jgi:glycosyltransferase involved in cell wall biosynthesis
MPDLRVLHVAGLLDPAYGGPSIVPLDLCHALHRQGVHVELAATDRRYGRAGRYQLAALPPFATNLFPVRRPHSYNTSWALARHVSDAARLVDVVHIHSIYGFHALAAARAATRAGVPYIVEPHGALTTYHHRQKRAKKALHERLVDIPILRHAAGVRCASTAEARDLGAFGVDPLTFIVPHGVEAPPIGSRESSRSVGELRVLFLGRFHQKKRLDLTIDAFARVRATCPRARLRVVGSGDDAILRAARRQVAELGIADAVQFVGPVFGDDRWQEYRDADVFVQFSDDESFGLTAIEARAAGIPVIATRAVASVADLGGDSMVTLVESSPVDAAAAIARALEVTRCARATRSVGSVAKTHSYQRVAQLLVEEYERIANRKPRQVG